ncbi:MAG TPA: VIT domain-containing protein [Gemmatimonadaceae bacterium]|nr:VIT domain-containing protein [Gemmatimonadaceae bacterium]
MRRLPFVLLSALLPLASAGAQGWIIPRPCPTPPVGCIPERPCPRPRPCVQPGVVSSTVVRTASDVRVELADRVLRYEVRETFVNRGGALGEADYIFPLPPNAAFQDLRMTINGELVAGETMNAAEARRVYEEIVRRQRDPALVEWMGHGLLRTRIFPIAPGEEKQVVVRFQSVAEREGDALRVDYFRGSRPGAGGGVDGGAPNVRGDEGTASSFALTYEGEQYGSPYSPTHAIEVSDASSGRGRRTVRVRGDARDLALLLPLRRSDRPAVTVLTYAPGSESDAGGFALITVSPPSRPRGARSEVPRDVTFVVDVSGSMSGRKIEQARAAGRQLLATLEPEDRFRIIDFSTDVRSFRDGFVPATRENLAAAARYVDDLQAEGSTNISGALDAALREPARGEGWSRGDDRLPLVLFLTDGEPTVGERDPARIAARAADRRGRARVFTFGLGSDVHAGLLEQLAVEGRGTAHFVRPDESVERAVSLVASRLTSPVLTDVRVRAEGAGVRLVKMHPSEPADVFAGQDLVVLARYTGSGPARVRVEARTPSGPVDWTADADFPERERANPFVARLWATQRVGWLSAERRRQGGSAELDAEIRELGERYGIPTEFTSYFVREPGMVVDAQQQRAVVGSVMGGGAGMGRRTRVSSGGAGNAVAESAPPPSVATAPAASARDQAFERAKVAAEQRQATSLAAADSAARVTAGAAGRGAGAQRRVGNRIFTLSDRGVWTDSRARAELRTVRVKAYSDAYFKLIDRVGDLRAAFALGDRVLVAGAKVMVEVVPDAGVDALTDRELVEISRAW